MPKLTQINFFTTVLIKLINSLIFWLFDSVFGESTNSYFLCFKCLNFFYWV